MKNKNANGFLKRQFERLVNMIVRGLSGHCARCVWTGATALPACLVVAALISPAAQAEKPIDLNPIEPAQWQATQAAHLASRAGFGATLDELSAFAAMSPSAAVDLFVDGAPKSQNNDNPSQLREDFQHSGVFDEGLDPFPASRPATTTLAIKQGHALGVQVKAGGNRPLQPVVNKFFYWLRASRLETDRVAYW